MPGFGAEALVLATRLVDEVGPRPAGSTAAADAQVWVEEEIGQRGWVSVRLPVRGLPEGNVVACRGDSRAAARVFLAHTDSTHAEVPGANDNAAAVAVLLVAATHLDREPEHRVCLAYSSGEETGLVGARALADGALGDVELAVALDLAGVGAPTWNGLGPAWGGERIRWLLDAAPAEVPWGYRAVSHAMPMDERSDHLAFAMRGIPAVHWMARGPHGFYPEYHAKDDVPARLDGPTLDAGVRMVLAIADAPPLPDGGGDPAIVLAGRVVGGRWVTAAAVVAALLALAGLRPEAAAGAWRARGLGCVSVLARTLAAGAAAAGVMALALAGRDGGGTLAAPMVLAGGCTWLAVSVAWPRVPPWSARVGGLAVGSALVGVLTRGGAELLALPTLLALGALGATAWLGPDDGDRRRGLARLAAAGFAAVGAGYFLRPGAVRELAFHEMFPAAPVAWAALWVLLGAPIAGAIGGRWYLASRTALLGWLVLLALGGVAWAWSADPHAAPFETRERLHGG